MIFLSIPLIGLFACSHPPLEKAGSRAPATAPLADEIQLPQESATALQIELVKLYDKGVQRIFPGKIQYDDDRGRSSKISSPVVGRVVETKVKLGEHVSEGDVLLLIESQEIGTAYSDYIKANSDYQAARRAVELAKDLYEGKGISKKDLQQSENDETKARAEFFRAKERLLNFHVSPEDLDRPLEQQKIRSTYFLRSPLAGIVLERNINPGQIVGSDPSQVLFTVANLATVLAVADLPDRELTHVKLGDRVEIMADAYPDMKFSGKITNISDLVDPGTRNFKFRCRIENRTGLLKPEMFVRIAVTSGQPGKGVPAVPVSAIVHEGEQDILFVRTSGNRFRRKMVTIHEIVSLDPDHNLAIIREGLQPGEEVVVQGGLLLENMLTNPS